MCNLLVHCLDMTQASWRTVLCLLVKRRWEFVVGTSWFKCTKRVISDYQDKWCYWGWGLHSGALQTFSIEIQPAQKTAQFIGVQLNKNVENAQNLQSKPTFLMITQSEKLPEGPLVPVTPLASRVTSTLTSNSIDWFCSFRTVYNRNDTPCAFFDSKSCLCSCRLPVLIAAEGSMCECYTAY